MRAKVNRLQRSVRRRLNEWRNVHGSATLESLDPEDQSRWRMTKRVMRFSTPSPLVTTRENALSDSEKAEALADNLESRFQPMTYPSVPEEGLKASSSTGGIPPRPHPQRNSPHPSLPYYVEARSCDLYP
jgi:hypothetical protein